MTGGQSGEAGNKIRQLSLSQPLLPTHVAAAIISFKRFGPPLLDKLPRKKPESDSRQPEAQPQVAKPKMAIRHFTFLGEEIFIGVFADGHTSKLKFPQYYLGIADFNKKHGTSLKVISPIVADALLNESDVWRQLAMDVFVTDLLVAYVPRDTELGSRIIFVCSDGTMLLLPTDRYRMSKGLIFAVLGLSADDFKIHDNLVEIAIAGDRLLSYADYPDRNGFYLPQPATFIPLMGDPYSDQKHDPRARCLLTERGPYVGPQVRYVYPGACDLRRHISCSTRPDLGFAVLVEVPKSDVGKFDSV